VLEPGSVKDIAQVVRFANKHDLRIAVRGHGHSIYGQSLVEGGIVIAMSSLGKARNHNAAQVDLMLKANRRLFEESRALGGALYPFTAVNLSRAKHCFDPRNVLASGPDMF
jgi:hypothetical protein